MHVSTYRWPALHWMRNLALLALLWSVVNMIATPAVADSWALPTETTYASPNGNFRVTVTPRDLESQLAYFEDAVASRAQPGQGDGVEEASAKLERRNGDGGWDLVWQRPLANNVAPVDVVVSDDGAFVVTFDDWHGMGHGPNVVAIYGSDGTLQHNYGLNDIVPGWWVDAMPHSVSSINWRRGVGVIETGRLRIMVREPGDGDATITIEIALADGAVTTIAPGELARLAAIGCPLHRAGVARSNAWRVREMSDLHLPPDGASSHELRNYYDLAAARLSIEGAGADAAMAASGGIVFFLPDSGDYMFDDDLDFLQRLLTENDDSAPVRAFAAYSQDRLVVEVRRAATRLRRNSMRGTEMIFFVDDAHWADIAPVLATSGAVLRQIDPNDPVPPRQQDLANLPPERAVDVACRSTAALGHMTLSGYRNPLVIFSDLAHSFLTLYAATQRSMFSIFRKAGFV